MKPLRNPATGYLRTALAMAAFLLASQPARATAFLFAMPPQTDLSAPGAMEALAVRLTNTGPGAVMIAEFTFDVTTGDTAAILDDVTASTLETYAFSGRSKFEPDIATSFTPVVPAASRRAADATIGLGCATYSIPPEVALGGVLRIGVASPGIEAWLSNGAGDNALSVAEEMQSGAVRDVSGPRTLLPTGVILLGLGLFRRRQSRVGKRRRRVPGMRKSALPTARTPGQTNAGEHYYAV